MSMHCFTLYPRRSLLKSSPWLLSSSRIIKPHRRRQLTYPTSRRRQLTYPTFPCPRFLSGKSTLDEDERVRIGDVEIPLGSPSPFVPCNYLSSTLSPSLRSHLQWIMTKDLLGQDMMLLGPPGAGALYRRRLALQYAELTRKSVEVLTLSSDTTESDLKQRRELVATEGSKPSVVFVDQAPVRAAMHGRLLILDGLEKAERNVLPTLNNLLENREINLEDGRLLVSPRRYKELLIQGGSVPSWLVPVHRDFRVLATAVPIPPFSGGNSLDPPLRSRFQIRRIDNPTAEELYEEMLTDETLYDDSGFIKSLATMAGAMEQLAMNSVGKRDDRGRIWGFPSNTLSSRLQLLQMFPKESTKSLLSRCYPIAETRVQASMGATNRYDESKQAYDQATGNLDGRNIEMELLGQYPYSVATAVRRGRDNANVTFHVLTRNSFQELNLMVPSGSSELNQSISSVVETKGMRQALTAMVQEHGAKRDILLVSPKGEGKNTLAKRFCLFLGYSSHLFSLYKEMTSRDLFLRRATNSETGETSWVDSPLVAAAKDGNVCILDGIDKLRPDVVASLNSLVNDREAWLPDGTHLCTNQRHAGKHHDYSMVQIHPSFRLIALASLHRDCHKWLSEDLQCMFSTISLPPPSDKCIRSILLAGCQEQNVVIEREIDQFLRLRKLLIDEAATDCGVAPLSVRNGIRIMRQVVAGKSMYQASCSAMLAELLPPTQRASLESLLDSAGIRQSYSSSKLQVPEILVTDEAVVIGDFEMQRAKATRKEMVPSPAFFDIPSHIHAIRDLLREWMTGERSFLMLGNQGVGKNMIVDRLCQAANFEREYIQLHRDSTIGQLTMNPSIQDGRIVWEDSPLVRAVSRGSCLVIDEADKAPVEVIAVLKGLVEDGELSLMDGRRISRHEKGDGIISMHPNFTLFVLANRPGFPFLGNDFFREIGDCFATKVVTNPDLASEIRLLRSYAPDLDPLIIRRIAASFADLRKLSENLDISYPYSTREAIAVVKHMDRFTDHGIVSALHNVIDFDSFDDRIYSVVCNVFKKHGIVMEDGHTWKAAIGSERTRKDLTIDYLGGNRESEGTNSRPPALGLTKFGKWDEKNEAHVGGNQWAGGTGGSDTAGLGGRGGPYRLDRGHEVHKVSDEAKAQVSKEAAQAAREMAHRALKERLEEIQMSESEWNMYNSFADSIRVDVANLRQILNSIDNKRSERGWIPRQSHGELDDSKLVDGVTGEKLIYKRRGTVEQDAPTGQRKRIKFVMDCSGSMYRFNGYDERLTRSLEAALLIMESFQGLESRFDISMVGHSGDSDCIPLINSGTLPKNELERMRVLQVMLAHTQYCRSGDFTLEAMERAIFEMMKSDDNDTCEDIVIGLSDANLARYGIHPRELGKIMESSPRVKAHCIFIASFGSEAEEIKKSLPVGRAHLCLHTTDLPRIVRNLLARVD